MVRTTGKARWGCSQPPTWVLHLCCERHLQGALPFAVAHTTLVHLIFAAAHSTSIPLPGAAGIEQLVLIAFVAGCGGLGVLCYPAGTCGRAAGVVIANMAKRS